jgi:cytochrome c553
MADLGAFYQQHGKSSVVSVSANVKAPPAATAALLEKGACASCHGADFNKAISPAYPKIAGQHADYLYVALKAYKVEGKSTLGRANAIMGAQVKAFTSAELKAMAQYIGSLPGDLRTVSQSRFR